MSRTTQTVTLDESDLREAVLLWLAKSQKPKGKDEEWTIEFTIEGAVVEACASRVLP